MRINNLFFLTHALLVSAGNITRVVTYSRAIAPVYAKSPPGPVYGGNSPVPTSPTSTGTTAPTSASGTITVTVNPYKDCVDKNGGATWTTDTQNCSCNPDGTENCLDIPAPVNNEICGNIPNGTGVWTYTDGITCDCVDYIASSCTNADGTPADPFMICIIINDGRTWFTDTQNCYCDDFNGSAVCTDKPATPDTSEVCAGLPGGTGNWGYNDDIVCVCSNGVASACAQKVGNPPTPNDVCVTIHGGAAWTTATDNCTCNPDGTNNCVPI
ncbi:hypothetical protein BB559_007529 [Furculomyces boomerangus]|uniref:EGF-like domain-containing protein n=1 Tax=Furculomyces boomerangus TaxID=61424 RepID=A0A2T9XX16_9FUNG|nr:hypothetical protein BB559_007529 [Furculomyces boomerangus]